MKLTAANTLLKKISVTFKLTKSEYAKQHPPTPPQKKKKRKKKKKEREEE